MGMIFEWLPLAAVLVTWSVLLLTLAYAVASLIEALVHKVWTWLRG